MSSLIPYDLPSPPLSRTSSTNSVSSNNESSQDETLPPFEKFLIFLEEEDITDIEEYIETDVDELEDFYYHGDQTALHLAALRGGCEFELLLKLPVKELVYLSKQDNQKKTPLHYLVTQPWGAECLRKLKAKLQPAPECKLIWKALFKTDLEGKNPLHCALDIEAQSSHFIQQTLQTSTPSTFNNPTTPNVNLYERTQEKYNKYRSEIEISRFEIIKELLSLDAMLDNSMQHIDDFGHFPFVYANSFSNDELFITLFDKILKRSDLHPLELLRSSKQLIIWKEVHPFEPRFERLYNQVPWKKQIDFILSWNPIGNNPSLLDEAGRFILNLPDLLFAYAIQKYPLIVLSPVEKYFTPKQREIIACNNFENLKRQWMQKLNMIDLSITDQDKNIWTNLCANAQKLMENNKSTQQGNINPLTDDIKNRYPEFFPLTLGYLLIGQVIEEVDKDFATSEKLISSFNFYKKLNPNILNQAILGSMLEYQINKSLKFTITKRKRENSSNEE